MAQQDSGRVKILMYKWAGKWGPFKVKIPCGECALTEDVIEDTMAFELGNVPVDFEVKEWLSNWWEPLLKGGAGTPQSSLWGASWSARGTRLTAGS